MTEYFAMGGHGVFVWGAYGAGLVALLWEVLALARRSRTLRRRLRRRA
ncbi:MAG: heme exporter protein CcmD [Ectothiorhodospira sp.]